MRFVRNLAFGLTLAILAFALAFAIITYGPRHSTVSHSHYAEEAVWNGNNLFLTVHAGSAREYFRGVQSRMQQRRTAVRAKLVPTILFEYHALGFTHASSGKATGPKKRPSATVCQSGQPAPEIRPAAAPDHFSP